MSQEGKGANDAEIAAAQVLTETGDIGTSHSPRIDKTPLSIHEVTSSSNEDEGGMTEARRRRKEKMKAKIEKKAKQLMEKRIKQESEKHPFFGLHQVPHNYTQSHYLSYQFQSINLGQPSFFDGTDYPKWAYDMKMHLYGFHPSIWEVVVVGVTPPTNGIPTAEQAQDYHRNAEAVRVITSSLSVREFNKVRGIEVAKKIWNTLKEAHEGTDEVREGKMDLLQGELEHFVMNDGETVTQMYERLMILVSDITALGSTEWNDHKVTKK
jgi:hypothetical protein